MTRFSPAQYRSYRGAFTGIALVLLAAAPAMAQDAAAKSANVVGRVEFDYADGPPAAVEVDLSQGMFHDLFGIGEAAVAGVAEALAQAAGEKSGAEGTRAAAEQLQAAREIVKTVGRVVQGVRLRVYEGGNDQAAQTEKMITHYEQKLSADVWEPVLRAQHGTKLVIVSAARQAGAIKGVFVVATEGRKTVLANVVCDISPENIQKLTNVAATSGLQAGLGQAIEQQMRRLRPKGPQESKAAGKE